MSYDETQEVWNVETVIPRLGLKKDVKMTIREPDNWRQSYPSYGETTVETMNYMRPYNKKSYAFEVKVASYGAYNN